MLAVPLLVVASLAHAQSALVPPTAIIAPLALLWAISVGVVLLLTALTGRLGASALLVSSCTYLALTDGCHSNPSGALTPVGILTWLACGGVILWTVLRRSTAGEFTAFFNVVSGGVALASVALLLTGASRPGTVPWQDIAPEVRREGGGALPDVYFVVLDGYGRHDVLRQKYGFENPLVPSLRGRGFFVADRACANYSQTALSLASTLNLAYLGTPLPALSPDSADRAAARDLVRHNRLVATFRAAGYRIVTQPPVYRSVDLGSGDGRRGPWPPVTDFEFALFNWSVLPRLSRLVGLPQAYLMHQVHRRRVAWAFEDLASPDRIEGDRPTFVFAHILAPHPPFVFRPDGTYRSSSMPAGIWDGDHWARYAHGTGEDYRDGYLDNLQYVNAKLMRVVDAALAQRSRPVLMYVQGDHGPGADLTWEDPAATDLQERMGVLLALFLPDGESSSLPDNLSPVNAARVVASTVLREPLPMLPDRSYFSRWSRPYDLIPVDTPGCGHDADSRVPGTARGSALSSPPGPLSPDER